MTEQGTSYAFSRCRDSKNVDLESLRLVSMACGNCPYKPSVFRPGLLTVTSYLFCLFYQLCDGQLRHCSECLFPCRLPADAPRGCGLPYCLRVLCQCQRQ